MQKEKQTRRDEVRVRIVLTVLIVICAIRQFMNGDYQNVFICVLSLFLLGLPRFIEEKLDLDLPPFLEVIIMLFIFSAEILGEINAYYETNEILNSDLRFFQQFVLDKAILNGGSN